MVDLEPCEIRQIAADAGGIDPRTVERFLRGQPGQRRKNRSIVRVLRDRGLVKFIPKTELVKCAPTR